MGNKINSKNIYAKYLNQINGKHVSITNGDVKNYNNTTNIIMDSTNLQAIKNNNCDIYYRSVMDAIDRNTDDKQIYIAFIFRIKIKDGKSKVYLTNVYMDNIFVTCHTVLKFDTDKLNERLYVGATIKFKANIDRYKKSNGKRNFCFIEPEIISIIDTNKDINISGDYSEEINMDLFIDISLSENKNMLMTYCYKYQLKEIFELSKSILINDKNYKSLVFLSIYTIYSENMMILAHFDNIEHNPDIINIIISLMFVRFLLSNNVNDQFVIYCYLSQLQPVLLKFLNNRPGITNDIEEIYNNTITKTYNECRSHYKLENNIILEFKHYVNIYLDELKNKISEYI